MKSFVVQLAGLSVCAAGLVSGCGDDASSAVDAPSSVVDAAPPDIAPVAPPDVRYKWVGAADSFVVQDMTNIPGGPGALFTAATHAPAIYSPAGLGGGDSWEYAILAPLPIVGGVTSSAVGGSPSAFSDQLAALPTTAVITSLDFTPDSVGYTVQDAGFGYARIYATPPLDMLADFVTQHAAEHIVITALAAHEQGIVVLGFGDPSPTASAIEAQVVQGSPATLASDATTLAADGYLITAFGRTDAAPTATSYAMVGTRPVGSHPAHAVKVTADGDELVQFLSTGYAIVGSLWDGSEYQRILEK